MAGVTQISQGYDRVCNLLFNLLSPLQFVLPSLIYCLTPLPLPLPLPLSCSLPLLPPSLLSPFSPSPLSCLPPSLYASLFINESRRPGVQQATKDTTVTVATSPSTLVCSLPLSPSAYENLQQTYDTICAKYLHAFPSFSWFFLFLAFCFSLPFPPPLLPPLFF